MTYIRYKRFTKLFVIGIIFVVRFISHHERTADFNGIIFELACIGRSFQNRWMSWYSKSKHFHKKLQTLALKCLPIKHLDIYPTTPFSIAQFFCLATECIKAALFSSPYCFNVVIALLILSQIFILGSKLTSIGDYLVTVLFWYSYSYKDSRINRGSKSNND